MNSYRFLVAAVTMLSASAVSAQDLSVTFAGGYTTGEYGSSRSTRMANGVLGARWHSGGTTISASLPYLHADTPGVVFAAFDGTPLVMLPDAGGRRMRANGVGDPTFAIAQDVPVGSVNLRGTARVKVAVQDLKNGISTGKTDWSLSGEVSRPFGRVTPFASLSYRKFGDPTGWRIRDGFAGSVGASAAVGPGALAVSYDVARSTSRYVGNAHEIVGVYDMPVSRRLRLAAYGTAGLSKGAPGAGVGLRMAWRI